jgi:iron-sulfur cluster assembly protein
MLAMSPIAAEQAKQAISLRGLGLGIRMQVITSECAGLTYQLEFADQWETYELLFVSHEVTIGVSPKVHPLVDGAIIDFLLEGQDAGFIVRNPNIKSQCGCGESFYV